MPPQGDEVPHGHLARAQLPGPEHERPDGRLGAAQRSDEQDGEVAEAVRIVGRPAKWPCRVTGRPSVCACQKRARLEISSAQ